MIAYIIRRLLYAVPIIFGVMLITFVLFRVVGGDQSAELAGKAASAETIAEIRAEYGWDKPMIFNIEKIRSERFAGLSDSQFFHYLRDLLTLNFGKSLRSRQNIIDIIKNGAGPSLSLTIPMFLLSHLHSFPVLGGPR